MQYGHWVVQATASASNSRYLRGIFPSSRPTILSRLSHALNSVGASLLISFSSFNFSGSWYWSLISSLFLLQCVLEDYVDSMMPHEQNDSSSPYFDKTV